MNFDLLTHYTIFPQFQLLTTTMQFDIDIEPTFRFTYMYALDKQKDITMKVLSQLSYES